MSDLKKRAHALKPIVSVGKNGLTRGVIDLIARELKEKKLIKVRLLKGALPDEPKKADRKALAERIAGETGAVLIEQIGSVAVLHKT